MRFKNLKHKICTGAMALSMLTVQAFATGNIQNSNLGIGIKNIITDLSGFFLVLCPLVGGGAAIAFLIARSMADEQDGKMWMKRVKVAVGCGVGGMLVSGIINLLSSYF